jgi:hypothetical protein
MGQELLCTALLHPLHNFVIANPIFQHFYWGAPLNMKCCAFVCLGAPWCALEKGAPWKINHWGCALENESRGVRFETKITLRGFL